MRNAIYIFNFALATFSVVCALIGLRRSYWFRLSTWTKAAFVLAGTSLAISYLMHITNS